MICNLGETLAMSKLESKFRKEEKSLVAIA